MPISQRIRAILGDDEMRHDVVVQLVPRQRQAGGRQLARNGGAAAGQHLARADHGDGFRHHDPSAL